MAGVDFNSQMGFKAEFDQFTRSQGMPTTPSDGNQEKAMREIEAAANTMSFDPQLALRMLQNAQQALGGDATGGSASSSSGGGGLVPQSTQPSSSSTGQTGGQTGGTTPSLSVNGNSVNTGMYTIAGSTNDDGSLSITNNQTGQQTEVWGDPHVKVNGQDTAEFQKGPLNIQLQDGTTVHIDPTALNNGVAHIGQVSITNGDQTVTMGGQNGFENGLNTSQVMNGVSNYSSSLYNSPSATNTTLGADGNMYYNNANGSMGDQITAQPGGGETDLDNHGGGVAGGSGTNAQLQSSVQNLLESVMTSGMDSFQSFMMQTTLQQMDKNLQNG